MRRELFAAAKIAEPPTDLGAEIKGTVGGGARARATRPCEHLCAALERSVDATSGHAATTPRPAQQHVASELSALLQGEASVAAYRSARDKLLQQLGESRCALAPASLANTSQSPHALPSVLLMEAPLDGAGAIAMPPSYATPLSTALGHGWPSSPHFPWCHVAGTRLRWYFPWGVHARSRRHSSPRPPSPSPSRLPPSLKPLHRRAPTPKAPTRRLLPPTHAPAHTRPAQRAHPLASQPAAEHSTRPRRHRRGPVCDGGTPTPTCGS